MRQDLIKRGCALALGAALTAGAAAEEPRPTYNPVLRQNENWSSFKPGEGGDFFDPIKRINLTDDGKVWLSFGGSLRARWEVWNNFGFGPANDDGFGLTRVLLHADLHVGDNIRAFVEGKSALSQGRDLPGGRRTLDVDELDLQQAFIDVKLELGDWGKLTIRPGRQMLSFGKQRLVSPLPWANALRAWDGVSAILETGGWKVHGFWTQFAPVQKFSFNEPDGQTVFWGVYGTGPLLKNHGVNTDLYVLGLDRDDAITFNGTTGTENRYTFGTRLFGKVGETGLDYDVEGAYQTGEVGSGDVSAWMFASELGFKPGDPWKSRFFVGFDYASGDNNPGGDVETFNQLFPLGHAYFGFIDAIGRQNIIDLSTGVRFSPINKLTLGVDFHNFWRADTSDAVYNAGGAVLRAGNLAGDRLVGHEVDVTFKYVLDKHTTLTGGYSHFFTGDFLDNANPAASEDVDFFYIQAQFVF